MGKGRSPLIRPKPAQKTIASRWSFSFSSEKCDRLPHQKTAQFTAPVNRKDDSMDPEDEQDNHVLNPTPDDDLEESREDPLNTHVGDDPLPEDNDPPAADPTAVPDDPSDPTHTADDSHPSNDTDLDETEEYDQGL
jgi:hypothetical protein